MVPINHVSKRPYENEVSVKPVNGIFTYNIYILYKPAIYVSHENQNEQNVSTKESDTFLANFTNKLILT